MVVKPNRTLGLILGGFLFFLFLVGLSLGLFQLASETVSPFLGLWTSLVILCLPLLLVVSYRLFGLITAEYSLNRDCFYLRWGFAFDQVPISKIVKVVSGIDIGVGLRPRIGFRWPGCVVGERDVEGLGTVEFFATTGSSRMIVIILEDRSLAISPPDVEAFQGAFLEVVHLGSLEEIHYLSQRPDLFSARLWADRWARLLILAGLIINLSLLGYLAFRVSGLPTQVPFGFDLLGNPDTLVAPSQLLLLPIAGGFWWLIDLLLGLWVYRREGDRSVAYLIWGTGILIGFLLWGAVLALISAV
ncbi:MAG: hypothetical protein GTO18_07780 [Anaerolineales bacterium]|nr:hypothetical protein [Anaerolineales bacterium]